MVGIRHSIDYTSHSSQRDADWLNPSAGQYKRNAVDLLLLVRLHSCQRYFVGGDQLAS
jgi:hypothetical protein